MPILQMSTIEAKGIVSDCPRSKYNKCQSLGFSSHPVNLIPESALLVDLLSFPLGE